MLSKAVTRLLVLCCVALIGWPALAAPPIPAPPEDSAQPGSAAKGDKSDKQASKPSFIRIQRNDDGEPISMDTAITTYVGKDADGKPVQVDLVGAVHIGDTAYYKKLNKQFKQYDALLYELVARKGAAPRKGAAGAWGSIGSMLELDDQIRVVDYQAKNFVHADMSWNEMMKSMEQRDESFLKLFFRMIGQGIAQQSDQKSGAGDGDLLAVLLFSRNKALAWKKIMAKQFEDTEESMKWLEGPNGSTLVTERNKVALKVLTEQLKEGKRRIGIFYGAGHLPDMERRLIDEFHLKRGKQRWLTAWNLEEK